MERTYWLVRNKQWETTRKQGWFRYVVLRKAVPVGLSGLLGEAAASHLFHHDRHEFLTAMVTMFVATMTYGAIVWIVKERRYHRSSSPPQDLPP